MTIRRVYRKRRTVVRKRPIMRKRFIPRVRRGPKIFNFKRTCELPNVQTVAGVTPTIFTYRFNLTQLSSYTEFTNLFDFYRIKGVKITFYPPSNVAATGVVNMPIGEFYSIIDNNDSAVPTAADMLEYPTLRRTYFNRPHKRYFKPLAIQSGVYIESGVNTGYRSLPSSTWFSTQDPSVTYFGIKGMYTISDPALVLAEKIRVTATYYFQTKNVK